MNRFDRIAGRLAGELELDRGSQEDFDDALSLAGGDLDMFSLNVDDFVKEEHREDGHPSAILEKALNQLKDAQNAVAGGDHREQSVSTATRAVERLLGQSTGAERRFLTELDRYLTFAKSAQSEAKQLRKSLDQLGFGTLR